MAAGTTYTPIATTTLGSNQSSITFSSISGNYTDLILVSSAKFTTAGDYSGRMQFNSDTTSTYSTTFLYGNGTSAASSRITSNTDGVYCGRFTNEWGNGITHIMNYSNTTTFKTVLDRGNNPTNLVAATANLWRSTSAITSITFKPDAGLTWASGSTFTLYGIKAA